MNGIPRIGGVSGIFDVFVPGLFLLFNFGIFLYFFPYLTEETLNQIKSAFSHPTLIILISISLGYLLGVILRISRVKAADKWSGRFLRIYSKNCRRKASRSNLYCHSKFPYIGWIGVICQRSMSNDVLEFYYDYWARFKVTKKTIEYYTKESTSDQNLTGELIQKLSKLIGNKSQNKHDFITSVKAVLGSDYSKYRKQILRYACLWGSTHGQEFYNFCKTIVISNDESSSIEIYARSSLTRYISNMFYGLVMSVILVLIAIIINLISASYGIEINSEINYIYLSLLILYVLAILVILGNLRYMRLSEVQTVFYACYANKELFLNAKSENNSLHNSKSN